MKQPQKTSKGEARIGLWSTEYLESTGQALVTRRVTKHVLPALGGYRRYVFPATGQPRAVGIWIFAWLRLWLDIVLGRVDTLYLVCSRSNSGFFRDFPALVAARSGLRVVVHAHGSDIVDLLSRRWLSPLAQWAYSHCDLVVPSMHLVKPLEYLVESVTICEGFFADTSETMLDTPRDNVGLTVLWNSNVMASKGFFDLANAIKRANDEGMAISLLSLGVLLEDEEMSLAELNTNFGAIENSNWFEYIGRVEHPLAVKILTNADVIALPSRYSSECQPLAIIEAMCSGRAVLVSELPALRVTVGDYPAELVAVQSVEAIFLALQRLYAEKQADPVEFTKRRVGPALVARERFAIGRFDREIGDIISKTAGH